ncbi:MAG: hypothetical protein LQ344_007732 [Seirophora lacunosa]|nr:MAG: hypothetical protein LQ344_007732 [Seirophora lacunosa]
MPFRDKVKKAFGKSSDDPSESALDLSQLQSKPSSKKVKKQKTEFPEDVYKPGEIPESKYKGPYNKAHQQKLHAFSFASAFQGRRKSDQSLYSPMGSRMPSRMNSFISRRTRSRQQSRVEDTLMENSEADDAVENVGMSQRHTREEVPKGETRPRTRASQEANDAHARGPPEGTTIKGLEGHVPSDKTHFASASQKIYTSDVNRMEGIEGDYRQISFGQPFSADDLVRAMTQSSLKPSAVQA